MIKYQNAVRGANDATFIEVGTFNGSSLVVRAKNSTFSPAPGMKTEMVAGVVRIVSPVDVTQGDLVAPVEESVEIRFNVRKGNDASLTALRTEATRVLAAAVTSYHLAKGLVPPSEATFTQA